MNFGDLSMRERRNGERGGQWKEMIRVILRCDLHLNGDVSFSRERSNVNFLCFLAVLPVLQNVVALTLIHYKKKKSH